MQPHYRRHNEVILLTQLHLLLSEKLQYMHSTAFQHVITLSIKTNEEYNSSITVIVFNQVTSISCVVFQSPHISCFKSGHILCSVVFTCHYLGTIYMLLYYFQNYFGRYIYNIPYRDTELIYLTISL